MKAASPLLALLSVALPYAQAVAADDQSEMTFDQGSVLVICAPPEGTELSTEEFDAAFPQWISTLQTRANDGVVTRAHYLGELKAGIFIVVGGEDRDAAMDNAVAVSDELNAIFNETVGSGAVGTCAFREIGPVAILPQ